MRLESAHIKRFRSIEEGRLTGCDGFNVLIGKNNSGKSNLLLAVSSFFGCVRTGNVVTLNPPVGKDIDFFGKHYASPIEMTLSFSLSDEEIVALKQEIVDEAPQMRNAAESIKYPLWLNATVCIVPPPRSFGFVSELALVDSGQTEIDQPRTIQTLLVIDNAAGTELHNRFFQSDQLVSQADAISAVSRRDIELYMDSVTEGRTGPPIDYLLRRRGSSRSIGRSSVQAVERILEEASTYDEAYRELQSYVSSLREEAQSIQAKPLSNRIGTFSGEESYVPDYVRKLLATISEMKVLYLKDRRKAIGEEEAKRLLDLKVRRGGTEVLHHIQETVEALMGVRIDAFAGASPSRREELSAELDVDDFLVQVNGSGIREALRLVLDYEFERPTLLFVEEPEMHLHPALETSTMRYLKRISGECQVFATTHSTNFLDTGDLRNVYLVSKNDISTQVRLLNVEEAEAQIPRELGIKLSSFFMFDRLVFVEGPSDEDIVREWATTLGVNFSQANVGFVSMGGVRNFTHFAAEKVLSFLTKRQVDVWFLMDRDERNEDEVTKIESQLGDKAKVHFLKRREIENYLLVPRPVVELIALKKQSPTFTETTSVSEVRSKIEACADTLKQTAVDKRVAKNACKPVFPSRDRLVGEEAIEQKVTAELDRMIAYLEEAKCSIPKLMDNEAEAIDRHWPERKLSLVPGDELLDMVFQEYGLRFRKERDGARLAALMQEDEIEQEIASVIRGIGSV